MAQTVITKNGTNQANLVAQGLETGELAINTSTSVLYYGDASGTPTFVRVGGLAAGWVGSTELASGAVMNSKIANDAVTL